MPLHLLGKKSWNIYNPVAQARIAKDEAEAAAKEQENDRRMQEYDLERRLAILRGDEPPPAPVPLAEKREQGHERRRRKDEGNGDWKQKKRRLAGEDDTDRDLRLAREEIDESRYETGTLQRPKKSSKPSNAPITDKAGYINLFPIDDKAQRPKDKNAEAEAEKKRKEKEFEDQFTMRFENAAGRDGLKSGIWYTNNTASKLDSSVANRALAPSKRSSVDGNQDDTNNRGEYALAEYTESKNVWGRPDPARKDREKSRISTADPLAFMQRAQTQLVKAREDKVTWDEQKERELRRLKRKEREWEREKEERRRQRRRREEEQEIGHREGRGRHRHEESDLESLEGFSLDVAVPNGRDSEKRVGRHGSSRLESSGRRKAGEHHVRRDEDRHRHRQSRPRTRSP